MWLFYVIVLQLLRFTLSHPSVDGYYWRDYGLEIPPDAFPGGLDEHGRPIYIGQVLFENKLIPGKIYSNNSNIYYQWGPEQSTDKNIKILCSRHPENFEWIQTKPDEIHLLTDKFLLKGGYEAGYNTFIGRVHAGEETTVGKVICKLIDCLGLYITHHGKFTEYKGVFEVLSYKQSKRNDTSTVKPSSTSLNVQPQ